MIAVINTIIASSFYRNPYQTNIKKAVRKISFANCFFGINVSFDMFCPHYYAFYAERTYNEVQCNWSYILLFDNYLFTIDYINTLR